jgi:hypothetical protein
MTGPEAKSLPDKYPEQERYDKDHEDEGADRCRDPELQRGGRGVLAPAASDAREPVLLVSSAFLHERGLPSPPAD